MIHTCIADNDLNYHVGFTRGANMHKTIMACGYYICIMRSISTPRKKRNMILFFFSRKPD